MTTATITPISKYRALILVLATEKGYQHSQSSTLVDTYTKGEVQITCSWGNSQLKGFTHMKGQALVTSVQGGQVGKLQRLQSSLGKPMAVTSRWGLSQAQKEALDQLAATSFTLIDALSEAASKVQASTPKPSTPKGKGKVSQPSTPKPSGPTQAQRQAAKDAAHVKDM